MGNGCVPAATDTCIYESAWYNFHMIPYAKNAKKHPDSQLKQIALSLKEYGWQQPIVTDKDDVIIVGHGRYEAYQKYPEGIGEPWVVKADKLTKEQVRGYRLMDNKTNESDWDNALVLEELKELDNLGFDIELTGFDRDLLIESDEKDDEIPTDAPTRAKLGDLWLLGEHKVLCGDAVKMDDCVRLMGDKKANMVFTDPPYLMGFTGNVHADGSKSHNASFGAIKNDKMSVADGKVFIGDMVRGIQAFCAGAFYICFYRLGLHYVFNALDENGMEYKAVIIWDKGNHTLSNSDYMSKYEPIVYGWTDEHKFYGGRSNFDIWDIPRTQKNELHPTMKPVALCERAILNSSEQNGIVLDMFLGSGSTLIAAEKTNRICYGMELDPKYVDVILKRWEDYTGKEAVKL